MLITPSFVDKFLIIELFTSKYFMIDYWSFVHLVSGILFGYIFYLLNKKKEIRFKWLIVLWFLVVYEMFEIGIFNNTIFISEPYANIFGDLVVGMFGYFIFNIVVWVTNHNLKTKTL